MSNSMRYGGRIAGFCMIALPVVLSCLHSSEAAVHSGQKEPSKITAVYHCDYSPISFWDKRTDKASGFLVDMTDSIATRTGLQVTYICRNGWPDIIDAIERGEADVGALIRTEKREKRLLFSDPIETTYLAFFARTQSKIDPDKMDGHMVGAVRGGQAYEYLEKRPGLILRTENSHQNGLFSLLAGEIDLFAAEEATCTSRAREAGLEDRIKITGKPFAEGARCFIMRKGNVGLLALLNRALPELKESPDYQRIYAKWYGKPKPYWTVRRALAGSGIVLVIVVFSLTLWRYLSVLKINRDLNEQMAERRYVEQALRTSEERYRTLIEQASDGIFIADTGGKYLDANQSGCRMLGYSREQLLRMNMRDLVPADEQAVIPLRVDELKRGKAILSERNLIRRDRSLIPVEINASMLPDGRLLGIVRDITERKKAEDMLRNYAGRLRALSSRLMEARESERRFIAYELHDEIGQSLTAAKLSLDAVRRFTDGDTTCKLLRVQEQLNELMVRVRDLSLNLRPAMLDTLGLIQALLWHFGRFTEQTGIQVHFDNDCKGRRFSMEIETGLYRIIQESLTNVARHAGVGSVQVRLAATDQAVVAAIQDKGAGFDLNVVMEKGRTMGLAGLYERVEDLGGTLAIQSRPGAGTSLTVTIPLVNGPAVEENGGGLPDPEAGNEV